MRPPLFDGKGTLSCVEITRSHDDDGQDYNPHRTVTVREQRVGGCLGHAISLEVEVALALSGCLGDPPAQHMALLGGRLPGVVP